MKLVTINRYTLPHELVIHRSKLEAMGIECFTQDELTVQVHNLYSNAIGGVKLQVKETDVEEALKILTEEFDLKTEDETSLIKCPNCGSGNVSGKGINGKIFFVLAMLFNLTTPTFSSKAKCFNCYHEFDLKKRS